MKQDEINHRVSAERAGAAQLSWPGRVALCGRCRAVMTWDRLLDVRPVEG